MVNESMPSLDIGQVRRVLSEALDVWSRGSVLTFKEVRSSDADIQVLFARWVTSTSSGLRRTHTNVLAEP